MNPLLRPAVLMALAIPFLAAQAPDAKHKRETLVHARAAYYNLRARGLVSYQGAMDPDWAGVLADAGKADPEGAKRAIALLEAIHFRLNLGADDSVKLTHDQVQAPNEAAEKGLAQIYGGAEQMVQGFFETWSLFMLNHPFPAPDSAFDLTPHGDQIEIRYKEGGSTVLTTLNRKDSRITSLSVKGAAFDSLIQPQFEDSPDGLVLVGYQGDYQSGNAAETTRLQVGIEYQETQGLKLPKKLSINGSYGGTPFAIIVRFSGLGATLK